MLAGGLAAVAVLGAAAFTLPGGDDAATPTASRSGFTAEAPAAKATPRGTDPVSRSVAAARAALESAPLAATGTGEETSAPALVAASRLWVADPVELRTGPGESFDADGDAAEGDRLDVTGTTQGEWSEVLVDAKPRWVPTASLSSEKPGLSSAPCPGGSGVERGLRASTVAVHRAVCHEFPAVGSYGGIRGDGEHSQGQALDIMTAGADGDAIAAWVREHASELGVTEVIWEQRIWTTQRASEGWRSMEDRGSATANHFDHVHVTTG